MPLAPDVLASPQVRIERPRPLHSSLQRHRSDPSAGPFRTPSFVRLPHLTADRAAGHSANGLQERFRRWRTPLNAEGTRNESKKGAAYGQARLRLHDCDSYAPSQPRPRPLRIPDCTAKIFGSLSALGPASGRHVCADYPVTLTNPSQYYTGNEAPATLAYMLNVDVSD